MSLINRSRKLSYLLRHDKDYKFDNHGWRKVSNLVDIHGFSLEELCKIVNTNDKRRFEFSDNMEFIRARQGHSIDVDVELATVIPPDELYHGTSINCIEKILEEGLLSQRRIHVHLSTSINDAMNIGKRHGEPIVLKINSKQMYANGFEFYLSKNGVWLTNLVPSKYIEVIALSQKMGTK